MRHLGLFREQNMKVKQVSDSVGSTDSIVKQFLLNKMFKSIGFKIKAFSLANLPKNAALYAR